MPAEATSARIQNDPQLKKVVSVSYSRILATHPKSLYFYKPAGVSPVPRLKFQAPKPVIFYKSTTHRQVRHGSVIYIPSDSTNWLQFAKTRERPGVF